MIRSMLLNGRATLAKADAMGLSVLLVFTVIVSKSILQHILLNNEHCVLYHHATKVAYTACKRVRKVLSGTLDKVNIEMGHNSLNAYSGWGHFLATWGIQIVLCC
ncbi:hypothetical protein DPEC_G00003960 [Dallia pectoralis]|uniref:Uncharacterized protein n=1 Tax=Dallia pectoralis TaxID=75939 RepID=A0ACC2HJS5_DALPE|nr:hypothetical protein DPEC_G00003960 [Dallia pectoralis]